MIAWPRAELCHVQLTIAIFARNQSTMTIETTRSPLLSTRSPEQAQAVDFATHYFKDSLVKEQVSVARIQARRPYKNQLWDWGTPIILGRTRIVLICWFHFARQILFTCFTRLCTSIFVQVYWVRKRVERGRRVSAEPGVAYFSYRVATVGRSVVRLGIECRERLSRRLPAAESSVHACVSDVNGPLSPYFRRCCAKKRSATRRRRLLIHTMRCDVARSAARNDTELLFSTCERCDVHACPVCSLITDDSLHHTDSPSRYDRPTLWRSTVYET